jgi:hypothetical protein
MTVPPGFRRNSETPPVLMLHKARLQPNEVIQERGDSITTAMRAILDSSESADTDILKQVQLEWLRRGLITKKEIKQAKTREHLTPALKQLLEEV